MNTVRRSFFVAVLGCGLSSLGCSGVAGVEGVGAQQEAINTVDFRAVGTASWGSGRADIVGRSTANHAEHQAHNLGGNWSGYTDQGVVIGGTPAAASWGVNRLDYVARSSTGGIVYQTWNGVGWMQVVTIPNGQMSNSPALVTWGTNRLDLFVRGANGDNAIYHNAMAGAGAVTDWTGFTYLGGDTQGSPAAVSTAVNRLDVAARGSDNRLYHQRWNGTAWTGFADMGGDIRDSPSMAATGADQVAIVAHGGNGRVWIRSRVGTSWTNWEDLQLSSTDSPVVVSRAPNNVDVIANTPNGSVYHRNWNGSSWSVWASMGGNCQGSPAAVVTQAASGGNWGTIEVFIRDATTGKTRFARITNQKTYTSFADIE
ncbi:MAG TPA: hypothetical protein VHB79_10095 [Polyangiaceae bacterium]|nr:hypothetical protein [Polyangiaceae bacterium]